MSHPPHMSHSPLSTTRLLLIFLSFLLLIPTLTTAEDPPPPTNTPECGTGKIFKGSPSRICLIVSDQASWNEEMNYYRFVFDPTVDELAKLDVSDSWVKPGSDVDCDKDCGAGEDCSQCEDTLLRSFTNPSIHVQSLSTFSFIKGFRRKVGGVDVTFPYLTAIISVENGDITGITWDEGCHFCSSRTCRADTYNFDGTPRSSNANDCYVPDQECIRGDLVSAICQLQVHAVWTGTDGDGRVLESGQMRFSEFKSLSLTDMADDAASKFEAVKLYSDYSESPDQ